MCLGTFTKWTAYYAIKETSIPLNRKSTSFSEHTALKLELNHHGRKQIQEKHWEGISKDKDNTKEKSKTVELNQNNNFLKLQ